MEGRSDPAETYRQSAEGEDARFLAYRCRVCNDANTHFALLDCNEGVPRMTCDLVDEGWKRDSDCYLPFSECATSIFIIQQRGQMSPQISSSVPH